MGQTIQLRVSGEDFLGEDEVVLERQGVPLAELETAETRFVSERELLAVIRIDFRAPIGPYGVTVRRGGRKRGAALEDFIVLPPAETPPTPVDSTPGAPPLSLGTLPGKIAFVRNEFRSLEPPWQLGDIHIFEAGTVWNASHHPADDRDPSLSPDGRRVAFTSNRSGDYEIFVMNADGSGITRLTNRRGVDHQPAWSPDGQQIAFAHDPQNTIVPECRWDTTITGDYDIWIIDADGSNLRRLTGGPELEGVFGLDWSPDGDRIVSTVTDNGYSAGLHVVPVNGGMPVRLDMPVSNGVLNRGNVFSPSWSTHGIVTFSTFESPRSWICFPCNPSGTGPWEPYHYRPYESVRNGVIHEVLVGQSTRHVSGSDESPMFAPSWSPDGRLRVLTRTFKMYPPIILSSEERARYTHFQRWETGTTETTPRTTGLLQVPVLTVLDSLGRTVDLPRVSGDIIRESRGDTLVFVDGYPSTYDSDPDWGP